MNRTEFYRSNEKLAVSNWPPEYYIQFDPVLKIWLDEKGQDITSFVNGYTDRDIAAFQIYVEPKKKKTIIFYEYIVYSMKFSGMGDGNLRLVWSDVKPSDTTEKHTGNFKTVEVEE